MLGRFGALCSDREDSPALGRVTRLLLEDRNG